MYFMVHIELLQVLKVNAILLSGYLSSLESVIMSTPVASFPPFFPQTQISFLLIIKLTVYAIKWDHLIPLPPTCDVRPGEEQVGDGEGLGGLQQHAVGAARPEESRVW